MMDLILTYPTDALFTLSDPISPTPVPTPQIQSPQHPDWNYYI